MHLFLFRFHRKLFILILCIGFVLFGYTATMLMLIRSPMTLSQALLADQINRYANTAPNGGTFHGCPAQGNGGDTQLNLLKNRMDTASWKAISFSQLATLPYPASVLHHDMS